jgi:hypothetical protein
MLKLADHPPPGTQKNILIFTSNKLKALLQMTQYGSGKVKPEVLYSSKYPYST